MADLVWNRIYVAGTSERVAEAKAIIEECGTRDTEFSMMGLRIEVSEDGTELEARFSSKWEVEEGPLYELEARLAAAIEAEEIDVS